MKKKFLNYMLAICLIIPAILLFSACGGSNMVKVAGKTYTATDDVSFEWKKGVTNEQKQSVYDELDVENDTELLTALKSQATNYDSITITFNTDGTVVLNVEDNQINGYYTQSEDLKTVTIYSNQEKTEKLDGFSDLGYYDGDLCLVGSFEDDIIKFYLELEESEMMEM